MWCVDVYACLVLWLLGFGLVAPACYFVSGGFVWFDVVVVLFVCGCWVVSLFCGISEFYYLFWVSVFGAWFIVVGLGMMILFWFGDYWLFVVAWYWCWLGCFLVAGGL